MDQHNRRGRCVGPRRGHVAGKDAPTPHVCPEMHRLRRLLLQRSLPVRLDLSAYAGQFHAGEVTPRLWAARREAMCCVAPIPGSPGLGRRWLCRIAPGVGMPEPWIAASCPVHRRRWRPRPYPDRHAILPAEHRDHRLYSGRQGGEPYHPCTLHVSQGVCPATRFKPTP
jgi:hypothetical protein